MKIAKHLPSHVLVDIPVVIITDGRHIDSGRQSRHLPLQPSSIFKLGRMLQAIVSIFGGVRQRTPVTESVLGLP